jgi:putative spermidine/putrescine transport system permease protein
MRRLLLAAPSSLVLAFLALPIVVIVLMSFSADTFGTFPPRHYSTQWYAAVFEPGGQWVDAFKLSALIAAVTTLASVALGAGAAMGLTRGNLPLRGIVLALILAPLIVPQIITALGLYFVLAPLGLTGNAFAIAAGHTVLALPVAVVILTSTLQGIDERLEDAAASMGASRRVIVRRIVMPLAAPGVAGAAVFSFLTSFDEFFVAQFLASPDRQTLPVRIFGALLYEIDPTVTAISAMLIALAVIGLGLVAAVRWMLGGRGGARGALDVTQVVEEPHGAQAI